MSVILLASQAGNGKDEICNNLVPKLNFQGFNWQKAAFAYAVKKIYCDTFDVDFDFVEKWKRNPLPPPGFIKPVRQSLQFIGDGFREIQPDIWIDIVFRNININRNICISDGRYLNEVRKAKSEGGLTVLIYRTGYMNDDPNRSEAELKPYVQWCLDTNQQDGLIQYDSDDQFYIDNGITRENMMNFDIFIRNDGTLEELFAKVDHILLPYIKSNLIKDA